VVAASDKKFKKDIKLISHKNGINIYSFNYDTEKFPYLSKEPQTGVIAQEVEHIPGAVEEREDGKYVNYEVINKIIA